MKSTRLLTRFWLVTAIAVFASAQTTQNPLPRMIQKEGRYALLVDGAPYLILGAQVNNSSAWPAMLPKVWPAIESIQANTVEIPVYWEQFEPEPGKFDYSLVDTLAAQAREHHVRLVLLWFGTWKNGSSHYMPLWMKREPERYPRVTGAKGKLVDSPSPYSAATLAADKHAFAALMRHLKADRSAANRNYGAGGKRSGDMGQRPRSFARGSEGVRRAGAGNTRCRFTQAARNMD